MENRKNFLDEIAKKLNIKTPSDWGSVTTHMFFELGGSTLLKYYYNGSLFACLQSVYKGTYLNFIDILNRYKLEKGMVSNSKQKISSKSFPKF
jgi:hypothetical protein